MSARKGEPQRTCIACRRVRPKTELLRLVVRGDRVVGDTDGTMTGRGAYVCPDDVCRKRAASKAARALRAPGATMAMEGSVQG